MSDDHPRPLGRPRKPWVDNKTERRRAQWRESKRKAQYRRALRDRVAA